MEHNIGIKVTGHPVFKIDVGLQSHHNILFTFCSGEGGRSKPVLSGYIQKLYAATWNTTFRLDLPESGGTEMILPGEQATIKVSRRGRQVESPPVL